MSNWSAGPGEENPKAGVALLPYTAWTAFATALNADIWRRNRR